MLKKHIANYHQNVTRRQNSTSLNDYNSTNYRETAWKRTKRFHVLHTMPVTIKNQKEQKADF